MESLGAQFKERLDCLIKPDSDPRDQQDYVHFIVENLKYFSPKQCKQLSALKNNREHVSFLLGMLEVNKGIPENVKLMVQNELSENV